MSAAVTDQGALVRKAAEVAEASFNRLVAASEDGKVYSILVVPPNVAGDDFPIIALPIEGNPLPFGASALSNLQSAFDRGFAVYVVANDESVLLRVGMVLRRLASMVTPPGDVS